MSKTPQNFISLTTQLGDSASTHCTGGVGRACITSERQQAEVRVYINADKVTIKVHRSNRADAKVLDSITIDTAASIKSGKVVM